MATIFQTTHSNTFQWMKWFEFWSIFHLSLFPRALSTVFHHWFRYWLGAVQVTNHYLNQWWLVYWRIYLSLGLNELLVIVLHQSFILHLRLLMTRSTINSVYSGCVRKKDFGLGFHNPVNDTPLLYQLNSEARASLITHLHGIWGFLLLTEVPVDPNSHVKILKWWVLTGVNRSK